MPMPINENLTNPLFLAYKDSGPTLALILPAILLNIVAFCGVFMNAFVIFTTIFTKKLRGTAHFLLSLICFCEILHQSGHGIFLFIVLNGINFIDKYTATLLELPMIFGLNAALFGMMVAAIDRLFTVIFPKRHKWIGRKPYYLAFLTILCIIYALYFDIYMYEIGKEDANFPVTGLVADLLKGQPSWKLLCGTTVLNGISVLCYLLIWLIIRQKEGVTQQTNTRITRSLAIIISINILGYYISLIFYQLLIKLLLFRMDFILIWQCGLLLPGISLNIAAGCNAPVLYWTSSEYRKAFSHNLHKLFRKPHGNGDTLIINIKKINSVNANAKIRGEGIDNEGREQTSIKT